MGKLRFPSAMSCDRHMRGLIRWVRITCENIVLVWSGSHVCLTNQLLNVKFTCAHILASHVFDHKNVSVTIYQIDLKLAISVVC